MRFKKPMLQVILFILALILSPTVLAEASQADDTIHFVSLTDIHFDPFIMCKETKPCEFIEALRYSPSEKWDSLLAKYAPITPSSQFGMDTTYSLLTSTLTQAKKDSDVNHARFVLVLGDDLGHNYRTKYQYYTNDLTEKGYASFVKKTFEFLNFKIGRTFSNIDIYNVVGNNDSYDEDYYTTPRGPFFKDLAKLWSSVIKNTANKNALRKDFPEAGYYAVTMPAHHKVRLLILNSTLFSSKAVGPDGDAAARKQIKWLHHQLAEIREQKQKALIIMHVPLGVDVYASLKQKPYSIIEFCKPDYTELFQNELKKYSTNIMGVLAGHTHVDWFQVLTEGYRNEIPVSYTPAISPHFGNNPAFKIFSYSPSTLQLSDFSTYFYTLGATNEWSKEYDFNDAYQPGCRHCNILDGMNRLEKTGLTAENYKKYFYVGRDSQPITIEDNWLPYYWCAVRTVTAMDYQACLRE